MIIKDYYKILNLDGPKVGADKIKIAYREQAKKYHPDSNVGKRNTEERFKDINEAYRVLSNADTKKKYDRVWNSKIKRRSGTYKANKKEREALSKELFNMVFGNVDNTNNDENILKIKSANKKASKGKNIETSIGISIEDGFYGKMKKISLKDEKGKFKTFSFKIPEGIRNNEKIKLTGLGNKSKNGGENGDLIIKIEIENSKELELKEENIYTNVYITPWEAILGTKVDVNSIDEKISIKIPKGVQYGDTIEIKGKGYKKGDGTRGNLIVNAEIVIPKKVTAEEQEQIERIRAISNFNPRDINNLHN